MKTKAEHIHRAVEICKADVHLSCGDLALLENACYEAAQFRKDQGKPHAEKYIAMRKRLAALSSKLDESIELKAKYFELQTSRKKKNNNESRQK